ncbi:MAG: amidohydrolase family protein [Chlorobi bacterium]|nr:amidohydrolase family protein [Chlorobiota bacterium]
MPIILKNATFINWETLQFKNTNVLINNELSKGISFINSINELDKTKYEIIDCSGKYVTKSFALGHHHIYSALARGMGAPKKSPDNFLEILKYIWWTLDKSLDKEMIEASALTTAIACAKNGVTFAIDHHASPYAIEGSLEIIAKAFDRVGVSHLLCYEITDRDGLEYANKGLDESENYLNSNQGLVGLHAAFTVGNQTLKKAVDLANRHNSGIHIHVAEDLYDQKFSIKNYQKRVIERLNEFGILKMNKSILGHCLHLNDNEKQLVANSNAWIVQNTESNLNNNVGYFNSVGLGNNIMLGTDGMHSNILQSAKAAFFVGQGFDSINYQGIYQRFRNVHRYLKTNDFEGDKDNNLVIFDYDSPTEFNEGNFLGHFLFGIENRHITNVISNGEFIVKNREIVKVDEQEILSFSKEQSKRLWAKMNKANFY